jgi:hypothetical protein
MFSEGMLESGYNLDTEYQVKYARSLLPESIRRAILSFSQTPAVGGNEKWRDWLIRIGRLDGEAVEIVLDFSKWMKFMRSRPDAQTLLKSMKSELAPWTLILKKRLKIAAPAILGRAASVYPLPEGSSAFVKKARKRWR